LCDAGHGNVICVERKILVMWTSVQIAKDERRLSLQGCGWKRRKKFNLL
jgi:hypothetical protein